MFINSVTVGAVSSAVWSAGTRTLSTLMNGGVTGFSGSGNIAAGATLDLRPAANRIRTIWFITPVTAPGDFLSCGLYTGTVFTLGIDIGNGGAGQQTMMGSSSMGPAVESHGAVSIAYAVSGWEFI